MTTIRTIMTGRFIFFITEESGILMLRAKHIRTGLEWKGAMLGYTKEDLESNNMEFPLNFAVPDDKIIGPISVWIITTDDNNEVCKNEILLEPITSSQIKYYVEDVKNLECQVKELENKVALLQLAHREEQDRALEMENMLACHGVTLTKKSSISKYFVIEDNNHGGVNSIVPNNGLFEMGSDKCANFLADELDSFLLRTRCDELVSLSLRSIGYSKLPANIFSKHLLGFLDISCNPVCVLPNEIVNLNNLKKLILSGCELDDLPQRFGELKQLRYLDMSKNRFLSIPFCVYELFRLETLNIEKNPIIFVPNDIKRLRNLKKFLTQGCPDYSRNKPHVRT